MPMEREHVPEVIAIWARVPYFATLSPETLAAVAGASSRRCLEAGQIAFQEGEPSPGLCVVQDGWLKGYKASPGGREQTLRYVGPGESFNEVATLADQSNVSTVVALEPATVWTLPRQSILQLIERYPDLGPALITSLARRAAHLLALIEDLSLRSLEARLARYLVENAEDGVVRRQRWATQSEWAARLGTVPDVLNRSLRRLAEAGLVEVSRRQVRLLDEAALVALAEREAGEGELEV